MTKHTPATPLPWKVGPPSTTTNAVAGQRGIWSGKRGVADVYGYPANAAYLAHAANAYPKLVEALRKMLETSALHRSMLSKHGFDETPVEYDARALLAEFGEQ